MHTIKLKNIIINKTKLIFSSPKSNLEFIILYIIYSPIVIATKKEPISRKAKFFPIIPVYV